MISNILTENFINQLGLREKIGFFRITAKWSGNSVTVDKTVAEINDAIDKGLMPYIYWEIYTGLPEYYQYAGKDNLQGIEGITFFRAGFTPTGHGEHVSSGHKLTTITIYASNGSVHGHDFNLTLSEDF